MVFGFGLGLGRGFGGLTRTRTRALPTVAGVVLLELAREVLRVEGGAVVAVRPLVLVEDRVRTRAVAHLRVVERRRPLAIHAYAQLVAGVEHVVAAVLVRVRLRARVRVGVGDGGGVRVRVRVGLTLTLIV